MPFVNQTTTAEIITDDLFTYPVSVDILPTTATDRYKQIVTRLTVDAVERAIRNYAFTAARESVGVECSFTLFNDADRQYILADSVIKFEIGIIVGGVTTWHTIADNQRLATTSYSIERRVFSFTTVSGLADKLNLAPETDVMIYDPAKSPFDAAEVEARTDSAGNTYEVEDFPVTDLTLYQLLNEIFVTRCGFDGVVSTIPDFSIKQQSFAMGVSYYDSLKGLLAPFEPHIEELGNVLYLRDSTVALPSDFPAPRDLTIYGCLSASLNGQYSNADSVELTFTDSDFDTIQNRFEIKQEVTPEDTNGFTYRTNIIRNYWQFFHHSKPNALVKEELQAELRDTYRFPGTDHFKETILTNNFDAYGRINSITRVNNELVPDLENEGDEIWKENVTFESVTVDYNQHPFIFDKQFQQKITKVHTGLIVNDSENQYLGADFTQSFRDAHRSGNLLTGQTYEENKTLKTVVERFVPTRDGMVKRNADAFDNIRGVEIEYVSEPRTGDVSLNGNSSKTSTLIVLESDASTKSTGKFLQFNTGDLPLSEAIPLARRVLAKAKNCPLSATLQVFGVDLAIRRGYIFSVKDLSSALQGVFIVEGYAGQGGIDQQSGEITHSMTVDASQVPTIADDAEITSYTIAVNSGGTFIFQREIACLSGYELSCDTVTDLTIEARLSGVGSYTNIETGALDLSTWNGTNQTFDIRLTAGATTSILHKDFTLTVARP